MILFLFSKKLFLYFFIQDFLQRIFYRKFLESNDITFCNFLRDCSAFSTDDTRSSFRYFFTDSFNNNCSVVTLGGLTKVFLRWSNVNLGGYTKKIDERIARSNTVGHILVFNQQNFNKIILFHTSRGSKLKEK